MLLSERKWTELELDSPARFQEACRFIFAITHVFHYLHIPDMKATTMARPLKMQYTTCTRVLRQPTAVFFSQWAATAVDRYLHRIKWPTAHLTDTAKSPSNSLLALRSEQLITNFRVRYLSHVESFKTENLLDNSVASREGPS